MSADRKAEGVPFFLTENPWPRERCDMIWVTAPSLPWPAERSAARRQDRCCSGSWLSPGLAPVKGTGTRRASLLNPARAPGSFTPCSPHPHLPSALRLPVLKPPRDGKCECCHFNGSGCICARVRLCVCVCVRVRERTGCVTVCAV